MHCSTISCERRRTQHFAGTAREHRSQGVRPCQPSTWPCLLWAAKPGATRRSQGWVQCSAVPLTGDRASLVSLAGDTDRVGLRWAWCSAGAVPGCTSAICRGWDCTSQAPSPAPCPSLAPASSAKLGTWLVTYCSQEMGTRMEPGLGLAGSAPSPEMAYRGWGYARWALSLALLAASCAAKCWAQHSAPAYTLCLWKSYLFASKIQSRPIHGEI